MIEYVIQKLIALLPTIGLITKENREIRQKALTSIALALNETYLYYSGLDRGEKRNFDTEAQLSKYWSESAVHISFFDKELAEICEYKSDYWINPDNYTDEKVSSLGIELDSVRKRYRDILLKK
jgi:hypothetical protein